MASHVYLKWSPMSIINGRLEIYPSEHPWVSNHIGFRLINNSWAISLSGQAFFVSLPHFEKRAGVCHITRRLISLVHWINFFFAEGGWDDS